MDILGALAVAVAVFAVGTSVLPRSPRPHSSLRAWNQRRVEVAAAQLERARLKLDPRVFHAVALGMPPAGLVLGWLVAPPLGVAGLVAGLLAPRALLAFLLSRQQSRSEREAPNLLQLLAANLGAGGTYLDAIQGARAAITDRRLGEDLGEVVQRFMLGVPLEDALRDIRRRVTGRNLALVWDNLTICVAQRIPGDRARDLLLDISTTVRFNVQLAGEVRAQTVGHRVQIWILALLVPAIYVYLRLVSTYFLSVLDDTWTGRFVLLPAAATLEVLGVYLSFRLSRVTV